MLTLEQIEERARIAKLIAEDAEADAAALDGQPFTGAVVAREMGEQLAMIHRLAMMVADLYDDQAGGLRSARDAMTHPPEPPVDVIERP